MHVPPFMDGLNLLHHPGSGRGRGKGGRGEGVGREGEGRPSYLTRVSTTASLSQSYVLCDMSYNYYVCAIMCFGGYRECCSGVQVLSSVLGLGDSTQSDIVSTCVRNQMRSVVM